MSTLLDVSALTCQFGRHIAVADVSFTVERGRVVGLLGQNGAGKTTTMNAVCGVRYPNAGLVQINGEDLYRAPAALRGHIGYLPDTPPLYTDMTVSEYLLFSAKLRGIARRARKAAITKVVDSCVLADVQHRLIRNLSKGFQQRAGLASALVHSPSLIVLDEPTVGLDPGQITEFRALVKTLARDTGAGVLFSTHALGEVEALCDDVVMLHQGSVALDGSLTEVTSAEHPALDVAWEQPPDEQALRALPSVRDVIAIGVARYRLICDDLRAGTDETLDLTRRCGWRLNEIAPQQSTLETRFLALTRGDLPSPGAGPGGRDA